jgi:hypothetical protein
MALLLGLAVLAAGGSADLRVTIDGLLVGGVLFVILQSLTILWGIAPAWHRTIRDGSGVGS